MSEQRCESFVSDIALGDVRVITSENADSYYRAAMEMAATEVTQLKDKEIEEISQNHNFEKSSLESQIEELKERLHLSESNLLSKENETIEINKFLGVLSEKVDLISTKIIRDNIISATEAMNKANTEMKFIEVAIVFIIGLLTLIVSSFVPAISLIQQIFVALLVSGLSTFSLFFSSNGIFSKPFFIYRNWRFRVLMNKKNLEISKFEMDWVKITCRYIGE